MATANYWAEPTLPRQQTLLFCPTLDDMIAHDDPVRLVDEVLDGVAWSDWEAHYHGRRGQPPIHPRYVAAALLYGLCRRIRTSRALEEACCYRLDFLWLVQGRRIEHTTFAKFRTKFAEPLKDLFQQLGRIAMTLGLVCLGEVAFDGTRVQANNSRYATATAKTLEEKLAALDQLYDELLAEMEQGDRYEQGRLDTEGETSPTRLPEPLASLPQRRDRVADALAQAQAADAARQSQHSDDSHSKPAQVPLTDPDAHVMPNKNGGYAPNYTPTVTTDSQCGFVVDCDVTAQVNERDEAVPSLDRVAETLGALPEKFLADAGNVSGPIMHEMEQRGVDFYAPVDSNQPQPGHPALRDDARVAVDEEQWSQLPRNPKGQLDKSCFVFEAESDCYRCPQGHELPYRKSTSDRRSGTRISLRVYQCDACGECPQAASCLSPQSKHGRTITRDEHEEVRERTAARVATAAGRALSKQRPQIAETPFGTIKGTMGVRQFLLRGLAKVQTEWRWVCTAFNLGKLVRSLGKLRAESSAASVATES